MHRRKAARIVAAVCSCILLLALVTISVILSAQQAVAGDYHAQYHSRGGVRAAWAGETRDYWFKYYNSGGSTWWAWGPPPIRLGIAPDWPYNAMGQYQHSSWAQYSGDMNRMTAVDNEPVSSWQVGLFGVE